MAKSINDFKSNFVGGTRKNRFRITGNFPYGGAFNIFQVMAASLPQNNLYVVEYDYRGRKLKLPGDRTYASQGSSIWEVAILDDANTNPSQIWSKLHDWSNNINNHTSNTGDQITPSSYKANGWVVEQLDLNCSNVLKTVRLYGCWPISVGEIALDMRVPNEFVTFNVAFSFDYIDQ